MSNQSLSGSSLYGCHPQPANGYSKPTKERMPGSCRVVFTRGKSTRLRKQSDSVSVDPASDRAGKIFAWSGTFWDILGSLDDLRRQIGLFGAHNEPRPALLLAQSQGTSATLILRQGNRFHQNRRHRLRGVGVRPNCQRFRSGSGGVNTDCVTLIGTVAKAGSIAPRVLTALLGLRRSPTWRRCGPS